MAHKRSLPVAEGESTIGDRIRKRRKSLGLSLRGLCEQIDLSPSFIAQVERGQVIPSIPSLKEIASALKVPMFYFFTEERPRLRLVREKERHKLHFPDANITYELLSPDLNQKNMGMIIRLGKDDHIQPLHLSTPTEEWMLLLTGRVAVQVAGERYELDPGDTISYEGWELQDTANIGVEEAILVLSMTPPAF